VNPGKLIAFEGIDGCGKSTQLAKLAERVRAADIEVCITAEPTQFETGRKIRAAARAGKAIAPEVELDWFLEDRRIHVDRVIAPALEAGQMVLCDRYTLSSVAYQGARGLDPEAILRAGEAAFPLPDLVLLFAISPREGLARVAARGGVSEPLFENEEFLESVAHVFDSIDRPYIARLDASGDADRLETEVLDRLERRLGVALRRGI
jgi:dTMP kinase